MSHGAFMFTIKSNGFAIITWLILMDIFLTPTAGLLWISYRLGTWFM